MSTKKNGKKNGKDGGDLLKQIAVHWKAYVEASRREQVASHERLEEGIAHGKALNDLEVLFQTPGVRIDEGVSYGQKSRTFWNWLAHDRGPNCGYTESDRRTWENHRRLAKNEERLRDLDAWFTLGYREALDFLDADNPKDKGASLSPPITANDSLSVPAQTSGLRIVSPPQNGPNDKSAKAMTAGELQTAQEDLVGRLASENTELTDRERAAFEERLEAVEDEIDSRVQEPETPAPPPEPEPSWRPVIGEAVFELDSSKPSPAVRRGVVVETADPKDGDLYRVKWEGDMEVRGAELCDLCRTDQAVKDRWHRDHQVKITSTQADLSVATNKVKDHQDKLAEWKEKLEKAKAALAVLKKQENTAFQEPVEALSQ